MGGASTWLSRSIPAIVLLLLGTVVASFTVPYELEQMRWEIPGMPESYPIEQLMRPILLTLLCYIPFLGAVLYAFLGTMDRYMTRHFVMHFLLCTGILLSIYLLADFTDNMERFRERFDNPLLQCVIFYSTQLPMFLYQILPYTLLMGALWSLSRWSSTCEITGMLQSGRSLMRVCAPIFIYGSLVALVYGICGFHWAPNGALYRELILKQDRGSAAQPVVYRHERSARIWYIKQAATMQNPGEAMKQVEIKQFSPTQAGKLLYQLRADSAEWDKASAQWTFTNAYVRNHDIGDARPQDDTYHASYTQPFEEKPYQIISPSQRRGNESMSTSALYDIINSGAGSREERAKKRTEWHVRIARVFTCIILLFLAVPSAVTFQRRGTMTGIALAIGLAALMLFLYRVFPSLGEASIIQAWISAWIPNVFYIGICIWLYQKNLSHGSFREKLRKIFRLKKSS